MQSKRPDALRYCVHYPDGYFVCAHFRGRANEFKFMNINDIIANRYLKRATNQNSKVNNLSQRMEKKIYKNKNYKKISKKRFQMCFILQNYVVFNFRHSIRLRKIKQNKTNRKCKDSMYGAVFLIRVIHISHPLMYVQ